jgi:Outer membrane protein beta-barrel domain
MEIARRLCDIRGVKRAIAGLLAAFAVVPFAAADELPQFQVGLHGGYRAGGSLEDEASGDDRDLDEGGSFALALEMRYAQGDDRYFQLWYSRQSSEVDDEALSHDVDVEYLHLGGTVPFGEIERAQPYLAAGLGATRLSSDAQGADDRTYFSGSIGVGVAVPLAKHAALRFEARGYLTAVDPDTAIFCRSDELGGVCRIVASSSALFQAEAVAGIAVRF